MTGQDISSQNQELISRLKDQEQQIFLLQAQQRDVRFLAKQLAKEVQLRLNKRAKRTVAHDSLYYKHDATVEHALHQTAASRDKLLSFIHSRDKANIQVRHRTFTDVLRPLPWKVAASMFAIGIASAKQVAKRVR